MRNKTRWQKMKLVRNFSKYNIQQFYLELWYKHCTVIVEITYQISLTNFLFLRCCTIYIYIYDI